MSELHNDSKPNSTSKESSYLDLKFAPNVDLNIASDEMNRLGWVNSKLKKSKIVLGTIDP
jgi:hypothetical protein